MEVVGQHGTTGARNLSVFRTDARRRSADDEREATARGLWRQRERHCGDPINRQVETDQMLPSTRCADVAQYLDVVELQTGLAPPRGRHDLVNLGIG